MALFGPTSWIKHRGQLEGPAQYDPGKEPSAPCGYLPGHPSKVQVLQDRVSRGERLWHKDDMTHEMMDDDEFVFMEDVE